MHKVVKSILVPYSAQELFDIVNDVAAYPTYLPWCGGATVQERTPDGLVAEITIDYHGIRHAFSTRNSNTPPTRIDVRLIEGPFAALEGHWQFLPLREDACKVLFELDYAFKHRALEAVIGPVFSMIANSFVDAFAKRAAAIHGERV